MDELTRLAHAARVGDRRALGAFIEAAYTVIWRLCASLLDEEAADDLAQEACERVLRALRGFRGDASARVWVLSIARRTCMDELRARDRRSRRQQRLEAGSGAPAVTAPSSDFEAHDLLRSLDPERRTAFVLTQLFGLSYEDTAAICECPAGTIRSRVARAREDLIALIEQPKARRDKRQAQVGGDDGARQGTP